MGETRHTAPLLDCYVTWTRQCCYFQN